MKGVIKSDHIPVNKYTLAVIGLIPITVTEISGIEDELQTVDLPDRTVASGGNRGPIEFTISVPAHHTAEIAMMEMWFKEGQEPVSPGYKKAATLSLKSLSGQTKRLFAFVELFPTKRTLPALEMANEGEMATYEWTMKASDFQPLG